MKKNTRIFIAFLLLALVGGVAPCRAQPQSAQPQSAAQQATRNEHMDAPETDPEMEQYRHSSMVQAIAHTTGLKVETTAQIFEDFNSGVLIVVILGFLWKVLPKMFRSRSENLQKELVGARKATEDANRRLAEVEARLLRLDSEIDAIRRQVEQESGQDEKRIHATLEAERERIVSSAEQEIGAAQSAAQRELKKFAADLAIDNAMRRIQLTAEADRTIIKDFAKRLGGGSSGGGEA